MMQTLLLLASAFLLAESGNAFQQVSVSARVIEHRSHSLLTPHIGSGTRSTFLPNRGGVSTLAKAATIDITQGIPSDDGTLLVILQPTLNELLEDATNRNSTEAATALLSVLQELRAMNTTTEQQEIILNDLLVTNGPDAPLPFWARFRPLAKYSRRARMFSLRRAMNVIAPPVSTKSTLTDNNQLARRRRALISLLRSLSTEDLEKDDGRPAIVVLEQKARQANKDSGKDLISRRPLDLETPSYEVVASGEEITGKKNKKGVNIEIRRYKPYSVCSVSMNKPRPTDNSKTDAKLGAPELRGASSFGALAGYLFGKNQQSTAMKMTTPVFTTGLPDKEEEDQAVPTDGAREMQFVLPSEYWGDGNLQKAPVPLDGSGVTLQNRDGEDRAVLMFSGYASSKSSRKRLIQLLNSLSAAKDSKWKVIPNTESVAQYNDPFTPPWRRLNEVSVKVESQ